MAVPSFSDRSYHGVIKISRQRGALVAWGPCIDAIADACLATDAVPPHTRQSRVDRDGEHHHITLVPKAELQGLSIDEKTLEDLALTPLLPLGIGTARSAQYVVLLWPAAQAYRAKLNLPPADLHITLGFDKHDTHDVSKGALQLLSVDVQPRLPRQWPEVVAVARDALHLGDQEQALTALERLIDEAHSASAPEAEAELLCIRGGLFGGMRRLSEALADAQAATATAAYLPGAWLLCAVCSLASGEAGMEAATVAARTAAELLDADAATERSSNTALHGGGVWNEERVFEDATALKAYCAAEGDREGTKGVEVVSTHITNINRRGSRLFRLFRRGRYALRLGAHHPAPASSTHAACQRQRDHARGPVLHPLRVRHPVTDCVAGGGNPGSASPSMSNGACQKSMNSMHKSETHSYRACYVDTVRIPGTCCQWMPRHGPWTICNEQAPMKNWLVARWNTKCSMAYWHDALEHQVDAGTPSGRRPQVHWSRGTSRLPRMRRSVSSTTRSPPIHRWTRPASRSE